MVVRAQRKLDEYAISAWTVDGAVGKNSDTHLCDGAVGKVMKKDNY